MNYNKLKKLDTSITSFQFIKQESEKLWEKLWNKGRYWDSGIQEGTKWKKGLTEDELLDFQNKMGFEFPECLKNYYRTMNGLDTLAIRVSEFDGEIETIIYPAFYSYPDDVDLIKKKIGYVMEDLNITKPNDNPYIFPSHSHRFLILDEYEPVLSMVGKDIIYWADNLAKSISHDIFHLYGDININTFKPRPSFWTDKILK